MLQQVHIKSHNSLRVGTQPDLVCALVRSNPGPFISAVAYQKLYFFLTKQKQKFSQGKPFFLPDWSLFEEDLGHLGLMQVGLFSSQLQGFLIPLQRLFRASLEIEDTGDTNYSTISGAEPVLYDRSQLKGTDADFIFFTIYRYNFLRDPFNFW